MHHHIFPILVIRMPMSFLRRGIPGGFSVRLQVARPRRTRNPKMMADLRLCALTTRKLMTGWWWLVTGTVGIIYIPNYIYIMVCIYIYIYIYIYKYIHTGWWFGTWLLISNDYMIFFRRGRLKPPIRWCLVEGSSYPLKNGWTRMAQRLMVKHWQSGFLHEKSRWHG